MAPHEGEANSPGVAGTKGFRENPSEVCEPPGSASTSVTMAILGCSEPHSTPKLVVVKELLHRLGVGVG
jgi:hypothetical protein